ncbi:1-phosphatidylinositol 4,5-bisphosphate phosphodiesterase eta-1-like [Lampris incognitus]|uniref:1-phosphatidylinositol 4,5-bisphosphate phosphodiesterase eta-1-like n=1 Tax=Lampris incognitus TaxID=2546036 RepID=UPI0024B4DCB0|nr:1-phosphatidylinositol 4,5-bisphosphate phosphodiesterase eta-1-like [Lampris incognitus]
MSSWPVNRKREPQYRRHFLTDNSAFHARFSSTACQQASVGTARLSNSRGVLKKSQSRSFITTLKQKRHSKSRLTCQSVDKDEDCQESYGREAGGQFNRGGRKRKTMQLSRDLSDLVVFTNSVASQECLYEGTPGDVLSFSETRAQSLVHHKAEQFLGFNQRQLSRIYPSAYRIDSSNFNPQFYWNVGCQLVALNYQTEGRMMQLNRAKFMLNGGSGYVLKPPPMCKGSFNPFCDDPLPAYPKKQLILKIISGQQLPKPPDSMLGDRGEIIDPFVEVEIIGLPVDCCKEQTRVVDDNGFNPVWEETLSFTLHMAEVALVRFLVWDHDPIGRDFVGQRTVAFSSLMPGYRHVYLEGLTEASIFVHVSVHDIYGKWSPLVLNPSFTIMHFLGSNKGHHLRGIRGLFNRSSKSSVETSSSSTLRKRSISDHFLRRTASAPAKGRKKTKMALAESLASISDLKSSTGAGAGVEGVTSKEGGVERRHQSQTPLTHRPMSVPLDRLLQGQLSLCSPDKEQHDLGSDTVIGMCPINRPRSTSVDLLVESSACLKHRVPSPSKICTITKKGPNQSDETSYLVICERQARRVDEYHKDQSQEDLNAKLLSRGTPADRLISSSENSQERATKPETSSNSATYTVPPSVSSSSSSSVPSSVAPLSPVNGVNMDYSDLKSPSYLQDSTISRLIDAVSLGNENDTCGSVSALIGQFNITLDQNNLTKLSNVPCPTHTTNDSNLKSTPHKVLHEKFMSPLNLSRASNHISMMKGPIRPQIKAQMSNHTNPELPLPLKSPQADPPALPLFSSPETTEQEEVYTILDEEVLSPTSVYNLKKQTIHLRVDSVDSTPSNSLGSSPAKPSKGFRKEDTVGWGDIHTQKGDGEEVREAEERVYEDVQDPIRPGSGVGHRVSRDYRGPPINANCFQICNHSVISGSMEVEINVDADPLDRMLSSPKHSDAWGGLQSPTKRHAICQKNEPFLSHAQQMQLSSSCGASQLQNSPHSSHLHFPQCSSPLSQTYQPSHQLPSSHQPSPFHQPINSKPINHSPFRQNCYSIPQSESESSDNNEGFSSSFTHHRSYIGSQAPIRHYQDRLGDKPLDKELIGHFQNGYSSPECLAGPSGMPKSLSADRGLYSPASDCDLAYSQQEYDHFTLSSASSISHHLQPQSRSQSYNKTEPETQMFSHTHNRQQCHPKTGDPSSTYMGPFPALHQPSSMTSAASSSVKSKSLGDLTSEDISCNFQSKYRIISRSFITPHMMGRRRRGAWGGFAHQQKSSDPLTEQLRKLVSLEGDDSDRDRPPSPQMPEIAKSPLLQPQPPNRAPSTPGDIDNSPPPLTRRLSSRSQSRVRHINSRARERQQEALKPRAGVGINGAVSVGGVVLRHKPASQNPPPNRHSTGSYIAGYLGQLEDRGIPEGACASLHHGYVDHCQDRYYTDDSFQTADSPCPPSEPEVYFLLRL